MAKKGAVNKSQAIRDYLKTDPKAGPKAIQVALAKKGIQVSSPLVSKVKQSRPGTKKKTAAKKAVKKKAVTRKKAASRKAVAERPMDELRHAGTLMMEAVELVVKAGATEAKQLVNMAADMVKKIRD